MASLSSSSNLLLPRSPSHRATQAGWATPYDEDDKDPFYAVRSGQSPHGLALYDNRSVSSVAPVGQLWQVNLGPSPAPNAPVTQPVVLPSVARFNGAQGFANTGVGRAPTQRLFPTTHIAGRVMTLGGAEALTAGLISQNRAATIAGGMLLGSGALSALGAITAAQQTLRHDHPRTAHAISLLGVAGLAALGGGGFLRQYARIHDDNVLAIAGMTALGAGAAEAAVSGGIALARSEQVASTEPSRLRANLALWALDAGVVTTVTYGLATRLNRFPPLADNIILGSAYTASLAGIVWQYADGAWYKRQTRDITPIMKTTWVPTALMVMAFCSKPGVLVGMKFAIDGYEALTRDTAAQANGDTGAQLSLGLGGLLALMSFVAVSWSQVRYFHRDLKNSIIFQNNGATEAQQDNTGPANVVTATVIIGAVMLAVGAGVREWAALHKDLELARGAMAIAGVGALSVVACSSLGLAASEINRGRAPLRHRAELATGVQTVGLALGVAYGLGIRDNNYSTLTDDLMLIASYLTVGIGGAMSYASTQLDKATYQWAQASGMQGPGEVVPLETVG